MKERHGAGARTGCPIPRTTRQYGDAVAAGRPPEGRPEMRAATYHPQGKSASPEAARPAWSSSVTRQPAEGVGSAKTKYLVP